jgi:tetratricopeptide (TPR) repeat protein
MPRKDLVAAVVILATPLVAQPVAAQTAEHDAIKAVIRSETQSFYRRDSDTWQSTWLHEADVTRTIVSASGHSSAIGWEQFGPRVVESLKRYPEPSPVTFTTDNFIVHVGGNVAWVEYDQTITSPRDPELKRISRERRALKKTNDGWKIVAQITIDPETFGRSPKAVEARLNADGYVLLSAGKVGEAIELFSLNARLNPDSWNAHDSLGAAYAAGGKKELAIEHYQKSLELNPRNERGKAALAKLKRE